MYKRLKELLFIPAFLFAGAFLPAMNDYDSFGDGRFDDGVRFPELTGDPSDYTLAGETKEKDAPETPQTTEAPKSTEKKKFRVKNRRVELSLANVSVDFANNFVAMSDIIQSPFWMLGHINDITQSPGLIWQDPIVIDVDRFFEGFQFNFGASVKPFSFNFNWKDQWGFGLDIARIDVTGNLSLSGKIVTFSETEEEEKFGVGGAVFVDVGVPVFFHYRDFRIKIRPAAYVPLIYTEPKVTYSYTNVTKQTPDGPVEGSRFEVNYDLQVYSLVSLEDTESLMQSLTDSMWDIPKNMGYDFGLNVEYPLLYDLDIGVDMVNVPVPFAAARLYHYMQLNGSAWADLSELDITDLIETDEDGNTKDLKGLVYDYPEEFDPAFKYNAAGKKIYRPFAMIFYAHYRPLSTPFLTLIPSLGFSVNNLYPKIGAVEGGLYARFDLANLFITTLGINYNDRRWKNSVDFILNLRAFELDLGLSSQSQNFARSWQGAGLGLNIGLKFGW